jgi:hypothetical protein
VDGASAALAGIAANVRALQTQFLTEEVDEQHARLDVALILSAIDSNGDFHNSATPDHCA